MQKTIQIKLIPSSEQRTLLIETTKTYIAAVNECAGWMYMFEERGNLSSHHVLQPLPSALKNQVVRDARSVYNRYRKGVVKRMPLLRRPVAIWNNQNFSYDESHISFPVWKDGKSKKIAVRALITGDQLATLQNCKLGTLRVSMKSGKWIAQISVEIPNIDLVPGGVMGVDLGLKCPAVCYTDAGQVKFIGNGRKNKEMRRRFSSKRKKLQKKRKLKAVEKIGNKENRIMRDLDHKYSRQIVDFAVANNIGTIKLEELQNIRQQARTSRKNNRSLHNWSFCRLSSFIEYKAALAGISVVYVNPAYTSQRCPICGALNHADDRDYHCACGFHGHRDIVGARNILLA